MADFLPCYESMIINEGGYKLHQVAGDRGGMTYAGIARNRWPDWQGWRWVDKGQLPPVDDVRSFYRINFWIPIQGDKIADQAIAANIFDFAVNAGVGVAVKLAQIVAGTTPDGRIGPKTLEAINQLNADAFRPAYALAKMARYRDIVTRDRSQGKFLLGWLNRTLKEAA